MSTKRFGLLVARGLAAPALSKRRKTVFGINQVRANDQNPISSADSRKTNRRIFFVFISFKNFLMGYKMHLNSFSGNEKQPRKMAPKRVKKKLKNCHNLKTTILILNPITSMECSSKLLKIIFSKSYPKTGQKKSYPKKRQK